MGSDQKNQPRNSPAARSLQQEALRKMNMNNLAEFLGLFATIVGGIAFIYKEMKEWRREAREELQRQIERTDKEIQLQREQIEKESTQREEAIQLQREQMEKEKTQREEAMQLQREQMEKERIQREKELQLQRDRMEEEMKLQTQRSDKLYEMFIDLLKNPLPKTNP